MSSLWVGALACLTPSFSGLVGLKCCVPKNFAPGEPPLWHCPRQALVWSAEEGFQNIVLPAKPIECGQRAM